MRGGGGNPFQITFGYQQDTSLNFQLLTQCLKNTLNKCIQELAKDTFFLYFHVFFHIITDE